MKKNILLYSLLLFSLLSFGQTGYYHSRIVNGLWSNPGGNVWYDSEDNTFNTYKHDSHTPTEASVEGFKELFIPTKTSRKKQVYLLVIPIILLWGLLCANYTNTYELIVAGILLFSVGIGTHEESLL